MNFNLFDTEKIFRENLLKLETMLNKETVCRNESDTLCRNYAQTDPNRMMQKTKYPFGKCKICKDQATGVHYGVATCEGCKGFFKRSILKKEKYSCFFNNKCEITPQHRNRCKACRFEKCIAEGMSMQGIKMGRIPKLEKEKALKRLEYTNEKVQSSRSENCSDDGSGQSVSSCEMESLSLCDTYDSSHKQPKPSNTSSSYSNKTCSNESVRNSYINLNDVNSENDVIKLSYLNEKLNAVAKEGIYASTHFTIQNLLKSHRHLQCSNLLAETCSADFFMSTNNEDFLLIITLLKDKIYQTFVDKSNILNVPREKSSVEKRRTSLGDAPPELIWKGFAFILSNFANWLISFAKEVPGMNQLELDDFGYIIQEQVYILFGFNHTHCVMDGECYIKLNEHLMLSRCWIEILFGQYLTNLIFEFHDLLNSLELTTKEYALTLVLILTSPENLSKKINLSKLKEISQYYMRTILYEFELNKRDKIFLHKYTTVLRIVSEINRMLQHIR